MPKLDPRLWQRLDAHKRTTAPGLAAAGLPESPVISVFARFHGDIGKLKAAGFRPRSVSGNIATGDVALTDLEALAALEEVDSIEADRKVRPKLKDSVPEIRAHIVRNPPLSLTGSGVIVGVVDTGIDIFHHSFRKANGKTRILRLWDQTITGVLADEKPPTGFTKGVEFKQEKLDAALGADEKLFPSKDTNGHGTHVAGTAAGDGSQAGNCEGANTYIGVAPGADLIIVKTTFNTTDILDGVAYIFQQAAAANKAAVVNLSLGSSTGGAHDGTAPDEVFIDNELGGTTGRAVVVAAGNEGHLGIHAAKMVPANGSVTVQFVVPAGDKNADSLDLWYEGTGRLRATVATPGPGGATSAPVNPGDPAAAQTVGNHSITIGSTILEAANAKNRITFDIAATGAAIDAGTWTITLEEIAGDAVNFDIWIEPQREDKFAQFTAADRVQLITLGIPGSATNAITVGAYDPRDGKLARFSSMGPTTDNRVKPEIAAPGVGIIAPKTGARSNICCDCCVDFYQPKQGTSMATPHVAGVVALMLQRNKGLSFEEIRTHITATAREKNTPPVNDFGHGKINAEAAVNAVPAPAGGGGGGPGILPAGAHWSAGLPLVRLRAIAGRLTGTGIGQLFAGLVSTHFDEVFRLINGNRRVATLWHRMGGPELLRHAALAAEDADHALIPSSAHDYLRRMLAALQRYGSAPLKADVRTYGHLVLAALGLTLHDLERGELSTNAVTSR